MTLSSLIYTAAAVCITATLATPALASVIVNGTRVIYDGDQREISVRLTSTGNQPVLVQSWIDDGDANASPERIHTPFTLTPPINRINPEKSQNLRISYTGTPALPQDRESIYWLNVLEIPAMKKSNKENKLQVAFRTRIKLFFRPAALADRTRVIAAAESLKWSISDNTLTATNESPYFVSLVEVAIKGAGKQGSVEGEMVYPSSSQTFALPKSVRAGTGSVLIYQYINDWGALRTVEYPL